MTAEQYEKIVTDRLVFGKPAKQIAQEIERKETVVFNVLDAFSVVKEQDWNRAIALLTNQNFPLAVFNWAGERLNTQLPPSLEAAYNQRCEKNAKINRERYAKQKGKETPPPVEAPPQPVEKKEDNTVLYLLELLKAVKEGNELLSELMDAVIPKFVADLKDNVNANCDSLFNQIKDNGDRLEAIKINTRKRGL